jgi:hypothetical protein
LIEFFFEVDRFAAGRWRAMQLEVILSESGKLSGRTEIFQIPEFANE